MYLLHSESADRGPIDLQDAVPGVDGISVVGTDVHPVDPKDGQELRQDEKNSKTSPGHVDRESSLSTQPPVATCSRPPPPKCSTQPRMLPLSEGHCH